MARSFGAMLSLTQLVFSWLQLKQEFPSGNKLGRFLPWKLLHSFFRGLPNCSLKNPRSNHILILKRSQLWCSLKMIYGFRSLFVRFVSIETIRRGAHFAKALKLLSIYSSTTTPSTGRCWSRRPRCPAPGWREPPTARRSRRRRREGDKRAHARARVAKFPRNKNIRFFVLRLFPWRRKKIV